MHTPLTFLFLLYYFYKNIWVKEPINMLSQEYIMLRFGVLPLRGTWIVSCRISSVISKMGFVFLEQGFSKLLVPFCISISICCSGCGFVYQVLDSLSNFMVEENILFFFFFCLFILSVETFLFCKKVDSPSMLIYLLLVTFQSLCFCKVCISFKGTGG